MQLTIEYDEGDGESCLILIHIEDTSPQKLASVLTSHFEGIGTSLQIRTSSDVVLRALQWLELAPVMSDNRCIVIDHGRYLYVDMIDYILETYMNVDVSLG